MRLRNQALIVVLVLVLLVFFYVWPGVWRYRYYEMHLRHSSLAIPMRTDKLTGQVQTYRQGAWCQAYQKK